MCLYIPANKVFIKNYRKKKRNIPSIGSNSVEVVAKPKKIWFRQKHFVFYKHFDCKLC